MGLPCGAKVIKILLGLFNCILVLLGLAIVIFSAIVLATKGSLVFPNSEEFKLSITSVWITILILGILVVLISFAGCCGAWAENRCLLIVYCIVIAVFVLIEIAAVIFLAVGRSQIGEELNKSYRDIVQNKYAVNSTYEKDWDQVQTKLSCCGVDGPANWMDSNFYNSSEEGSIPVPASCCLDTTSKAKIDVCYKEANDTFFGKSVMANNLKIQGCGAQLQKTMEGFYMKIIYILIGLIVIEILAIIFAAFLAQSLVEGRYTV